MANGKNAPTRGSDSLRLQTLPRGGSGRGALRIVDLDATGPRFARLRSLGSTALHLRTTRGGGLPATGLTWRLAGQGVALSLILPN